MDHIWLVTGYSVKMDGIACVVQADDHNDALQKVADSMGFKLASFISQQDFPVNVIYDPELDLDYIKDVYNNGDGPRRCHEVYAQKVKLGKHLDEVVCW